jgi:toxin-antitoxin system PIN domain toxin
MISLDSNLLLFAYNLNAPPHQRAFKFIERLQQRSDVIISEFALIEFYRLLRNSVVLQNPLNAPEAADVIAQYRGHPRWKLAGFPDQSDPVHEATWKTAAEPGFAYRGIFDARFALVLRHFGVTEFATANVKDFQGFGFQRVWNPLLEE